MVNCDSHDSFIKKIVSYLGKEELLLLSLMVEYIEENFCIEKQNSKIIKSTILQLVKKISKYEICFNTVISFLLFYFESSSKNINNEQRLKKIKKYFGQKIKNTLKSLMVDRKKSSQKVMLFKSIKNLDHVAVNIQIINRISTLKNETLLNKQKLFLIIEETIEFFLPISKKIISCKKIFLDLFNITYKLSNFEQKKKLRNMLN